jgi:hypothetical protein
MQAVVSSQLLEYAAVVATWSYAAQSSVLTSLTDAGNVWQYQMTCGGTVAVEELSCKRRTSSAAAPSPSQLVMALSSSTATA